MIDFKGKINGIVVDVQIPIEDVESTAILDFPQKNIQTSSTEIFSLKNTVSFMQKEVVVIKSDSGEKQISNMGNYDRIAFSIFLDSTGVIFAIFVMLRKKSDFKNQNKPQM